MNELFSNIHAFDYAILVQIFNNWRGGISDTIWSVISLLGNAGIIWIVLAVILLFFKKTRCAGVCVLVSLAIGVLIGNVVIKHLVMRPRPFVTHPELVALLHPGDRWSFPSGHSLSSFAAATALFLHYRKSGAASYLLAAAIAFSRLYVCVHYPTDVAAGMLLGILCGLLGSWITKRLYVRFQHTDLGKGTK